MNKISNILILFSIIICNSYDILSELNDNIKWTLIEERGSQKVFEFYDPDCNCTFVSVEKPVDYNESKVLDIIKDIANYNLVINNKSLDSKLIEINNDTIFAYQIIKNSIPFVRDRQYVFKMYHVDKNHIEWVILDKKNYYLQPYLNNDVKTLTLGAGSWSYKYNQSQKILVNKIYVDDEANLPAIFINKLKRNNVIDIYNDVINFASKTGEEK